MKKCLILILFCFSFFVAQNSIVFAAPTVECSATIKCPAGKSCVGSFCVQAAPSLRPEFQQEGALTFAVSRFFTYLLPVIGILGFLLFLWSGFQFLMSKGDPKALAAAQARLTYTAIGLLIIFLAYSITAYTTGLFGLVTP